MREPREQERVIPDEERARALLEQLKSVHAVDVGRDMVVAAVNFSYPKLGLSDETREVRDLGDVRLSIELIRAILEVLDREQGGAGTSDLHDTLAQMQLAYAHAVQLANAERAAQETPASGAEAAGEAAAEPAGEPADAEPAAEAPGEAAAEAAPAEGAEPAPETRPAKKRPAARKKADAPAEPAKSRPPAKRKPPAKKKPAAGKKPAAAKKPSGDG
jgi:hypothetical protein